MKDRYTVFLRPWGVYYYEDVGWLVQQALEIAQAAGAVVRGAQSDAFQLGDRMFFGQLQQWVFILPTTAVT